MKGIWQFSITRNIIGGFFLVLIPIIVLNLMVNYLSVEIVRNEVMKSYTNSINLLAEQLESNLRKFEDMARILSINQDLNNINYSRNMSEELIWEYVKQLKQLELLEYSNEMDNHIYIYLQNKNRILSSQGSISTLDKDYNAQMLPVFLNSDSKWNFMDKKYDYTTEKCLSFAYDNNILKKETDIVVCVDITARTIKAFLDNLKVHNGGTVYLLDEQGNYILTSEGNGIDISALNAISVTDDDSQQITYTQSEKKYWVFTKRSDRTGLTLGVYFPEEQILRPIYTILYLIAVIVIISILLTVIFTLRSYRGFLSPLHSLIDAMHKVGDGDLKVRIPQNEKEELGFMFTQFNQMVSQMDLLVNEVYSEKLKSKTIKLKFLQSQINPHFLYNCLYSVYHMINMEDLEGASNMSLYLGEYFRFVTRSNKQSVSIGEELDNIRTYIDIHKMRYPNKVNYHIEVDDEIRKINIPRLVIQPLVENAIMHGLEGINKQGNIWITGITDDNGVSIMVEDDGMGITKKRLYEVRSSLMALNHEGDMYGLCNTNMRLKLEFGADAGIYLETRESGGAKATIRIPSQKE